MSQEQVNLFMNNGLKVVLAITAFMAVSIFNDMRQQIEKLSTEVSVIRERLSYIEGQLRKKNDNNY